jgi:hypothetical protein
MFTWIFPITPVWLYVATKWSEFEEEPAPSLTSERLSELTALATELRTKLMAEVREIRCAPTLYGWQIGVRAILPQLAMATLTADAARELAVSLHDEKSTRNAAHLEFVLQEMFCDAYASVCNGGVGFPVLLPEIERAFAWGEVHADLDADCYVRARAALKLLVGMRVVAPDFVVTTILDEIDSLYARAAKTGALFTWLIRDEDGWYVRRGITKMGSVRRYLVAVVFQSNSIDRLLWGRASYRFKALIRGSISLADYLDKRLALRLQTAGALDRSIAGAMHKGQQLTLEQGT